LENIEDASVPERLLVDAYLLAFVQIDWDAEPSERQVGLWSPGTPGLSVAGGLFAEDAFDVGDSSCFAPLEFIGTLEVA
jgi:hypothetical protein